jgi:hypothetical protein
MLVFLCLRARKPSGTTVRLTLAIVLIRLF